MRETAEFQRSQLSCDEVKRIIDEAAKRGVKAISFTGGEPLLVLDELVGLINYAGNAGLKYIRTGTNGFPFIGGNSPLFDTRVKRLAEKFSRTSLRNFWISIDSAIPSVHEKMRGFPGVIAGIEKALPIFHEYGIYPSANIGITRNIGGEATARLSPSTHDEDYYATFYQRYVEAFRRAYEFAMEMGFTIVSTCYPMSIEGGKVSADLKPVYGATSEDAVVRFSAAEKALLFKALLKTVGEFRSRIRVVSPQCSLYALQHQHTAGVETKYACRGGLDFFFIDGAEGDTYPCGYRGNENLGKFWKLDRDSLDSEFACFGCDWECFRDPSELLGPILHGFSKPFRLISDLRRDPHYYRLWMEDLRYYRVCKIFDGRVPPAFDRLRDFG